MTQQKALRARHPVESDPLKTLIGKPLRDELIGSRVVHLDRLKEALGASGWSIYSILRGSRNELGETHITIEGIRSLLHYRLTAAGVRYQLTRLRSAGLLHDIGWQDREVPCRAFGGQVTREVYLRLVYGAPCDKVRLLFDGSGSVTEFMWSVPEKTTHFVAKPERRGGARFSNKISREEPPVLKLGKYRSTNEQKLAPDIKALESQRLSSKPKEKKKSGPALGCSPSARPIGNADRIAPAALASMGAHPQTPPERKGSVVYSIPAEASSLPAPLFSTPLASDDDSRQEPTKKKAATKPIATTTPPPQKEIPAHTSEPDEDEEMLAVFSFGGGVSLDPNRHKKFSGSVDNNWRAAGVPEYPSKQELPMIFMPNPPRLDPKLPLPEQMQRLLRYYHAACEYYTGEKVHLIAKRPRVRDFDQPVLEKAIAALLHHHIPPAAWAAFMLNRWQNMPTSERGSRALFPPMRWVWAVDKIKDGRWRSWYYQEQHAHMGEREIYVPERIAFDKRWSAMVKALQKAEVCYDEPERVKKIVASYWPGDLFDRMKQRAWNEIKATHSAVHEQVSSGGWPWRRKAELCPVY